MAETFEGLNSSLNCCVAPSAAALMPFAGLFDLLISLSPVLLHVANVALRKSHYLADDLKSLFVLGSRNLLSCQSLDL